jgi:2'-5' RNA ligase
MAVLHSIWLVPPPGPTRDALAAVVRSHAAPRGEAAFAPHVTLAGAFRATRDAAAGSLAAAAAAIPAGDMRVNFVRVVAGREYHRWVYLLAEKTGPLCAAAAAAATAAGVPFDEDAYMPHLSLAYGEGDATAAAATLTAELAPTLPSLCWAGGEVQVWRTEGGVTDWALEASLPLAG